MAFTTGKTGGVAKAADPEGQPINTIKDYLTKMAKTAKELPCKTLAATQLVKVSQGTKVDVLTTSTSANASSEAAEQSEDDAKAEESTKGATGCCGGRVNAATNVAKNGAASVAKAATNCVSNVKAKVASISPLASKIVPDIRIPTTLEEYEAMEDEIEENEKRKKMSPEQFEKEVCSQKPYPECAMCQLASALNDVTEEDILDLIHGVMDVISTIIKGNMLDWSEMVYNCPGQINSLLSTNESLGPLGALIGPCVSAAMIGVSATKGALNVYRSASNVFKNTDMLGEVRATVMDAFMSSRGNDQMTEIFNTVIDDLQIDIGEYFKEDSGCGKCKACSSKAKSSSQKSGTSNTRQVTSGETNKNQVGKEAFVGNGTDGNSSTERAEMNDDRPGTSEESKEKANSVKSETSTLTTKATQKAEDPTYQEPPTVVDSVTGKETPISINEDTNAKAGVTYCYKSGEDANGTAIYTKLDVEPGDSLEAIRAENGNIFATEGSKETTGTNPKPTYSACEDEEYDDEHDYYKYDPTTDSYVIDESIVDDTTYQAAKSAGTVFSQVAAAAKPVSYAETTDVVAAEDTTYYYIDTRGKYIEVPATIEYVEVYELQTSTTTYYRDAGGGTWSSVTISSAEEFEENLFQYGHLYIKKTGYTKAGTLISSWVKPYKPVYTKIPSTSESGVNDVLSDSTGVPFEPIVSTDHTAYESAVSTKKLITDGHVTVAAISQLHGIGLTTDELKVAYVLDHEVNGTTMPPDCDAELIPTILDTLADD